MNKPELKPDTVRQIVGDDSPYVWVFISEDGSPWCYDCALLDDDTNKIVGAIVGRASCDGCGRPIAGNGPFDAL